MKLTKVFTICTILLSIQTLANDQSFKLLMEEGSCLASFTQNLENSMTEVIIDLTKINMIEDEDGITLVCPEYNDCVSKYSEFFERDIHISKSETRKYVNFNYQTETDDSLPNILESKIKLCSEDREETNQANQNLQENYNPFCDDGTIPPIIQGCEMQYLY